MNKLITIIIHLAQKSKHIIKMFAIRSFPFLSQCLRGHFREVWTHAIRDVANCDAVCDILFGDNVDYHSIAWIWNGSNTNHIVIVHESSALPFVFVTCRWCCWITTHYLSKIECRVGIQVQWHTKMRARDRKGWYCRKPMTRGQCLPLLLFSQLVPPFSSPKGHKDVVGCCAHKLCNHNYIMNRTNLALPLIVETCIFPCTISYKMTNTSLSLIQYPLQFLIEQNPIDLNTCHFYMPICILS